MGPFDRKVNNSLDGMFDLNRDGYLSESEEAVKFGFLSDFDKSDSSDDFDDFDGSGDSDDLDF